MRKALAFVPLLILGATGAFAAVPGRDFQPDRCPKPVQAPDKAAFKRLGELPPANAFQAVLRSDDKCRGKLVQARDLLGSVPKARR